MEFTDGFINPDEYIFDFGKYKNKIYKEVFDENAGYILWCHRNVTWFTLSPKECYNVIDMKNWIGRPGYYKLGGYSAQTEYGLEVYGQDIMY